MNERSLVLVLGLSFLLLGGCSDDGTSTPDASVDQTVIADLPVSGGDTGASCGAGVYPCGPYGTQLNDVVENHKFLGFMDPNYFCKKSQDVVQDDTKKVPLDFDIWHLPPKDCPTKPKKLLWVMVSAGWCAPCVQKIKEVMAQYRIGALNPDLALMDILFETDKRRPATEAFGKIWAKHTGMTFPLALDPEFKMGKYFSREAVPFNMLIDLKTMKIFYRQTGSNMPQMAKKVAEFFAK